VICYFDGMWAIRVVSRRRMWEKERGMGQGIK
jgi:hypothetical protein